jgi:hypothetical protein
MSTIDIHGKKVHIDDESRSVKHAVDYLNKLDKGEAHNFFHTASTERFSHFETPRHTDTVKAGIEHDMTLEHNNDGTYTLRKKSKHW